MRLDKVKVQLRMAELKLTHAQLAKAAGISRQTLSCVMNGRNCRPDLLGKIAEALKVMPKEIIE